MRLLLDTHIALWAVVGSARLGAETEAAILAADEVFVSAASLWEIAIKRAIGQQSVGKRYMPVSSIQALQAFRDAGYTMLNVRPEHAAGVEQLPPIHKDPFDRMLLAQAIFEPLTLVTRDRLIADYGTNVMWVG